MGLQTLSDERNMTNHRNEPEIPEYNSCIECGLPPFLQDSLEQMKAAWEKLDNGEKYLHWDCDFCELQSSINIADVEQIISTEQAWYLREKYLRIEK